MEKPETAAMSGIETKTDQRPNRKDQKMNDQLAANVQVWFRKIESFLAERDAAGKIPKRTIAWAFYAQEALYSHPNRPQAGLWLSAHSFCSIEIRDNYLKEGIDRLFAKDPIFKTVCQLADVAKGNLGKLGAECAEFQDFNVFAR